MSSKVKVSKSRKIPKDLVYPKRTRQQKQVKERQKARLIHKKSNDNEKKFNPAIYVAPFTIKMKEVQYHNYEGEYTRQDVFNHCDKLSKKLKKLSPNSRFKVVLHLQMAKDGIPFDRIDYRSGGWRDAGEKPDIWDGQGYDFSVDEGYAEEGISYSIIGFDFLLYENN